jgi:hypothetical protein
MEPGGHQTEQPSIGDEAAHAENRQDAALASPVTGAAVHGDVGSGTREPCHQPACPEGGRGHGTYNCHFRQLERRPVGTCQDEDHRRQDSQQGCRRRPVSPGPDVPLLI